MRDQDSSVITFLKPSLIVKFIQTGAFDCQSAVFDSQGLYEKLVVRSYNFAMQRKIKQLFNSVLTKYHNLSVACRSNIMGSSTLTNHDILLDIVQ